jgi:heat shock protein HtpX
VTAGLLNLLDRRQIRGVLAHELGHIKNRDTLISSIAATLAGALSYLGYVFMLGGNRRDANPLAALLVMIAAPFAALLIRMAISRTREFAADRRAAELTGDPDGLADALLQLSHGARRSPMGDPRAQSVHFIVNGFAGGMAGLFSTHPPTEERVARLRALR